MTSTERSTASCTENQALRIALESHNALDLLAYLLDQPSQQRQALLHCIPNEALRDVVRMLLAAHDASGSFLEPITVPCEWPIYHENQQFGAYQLRRKIGQGGMGQVWLAERFDGGFSQQVAIKLMTSDGLDVKATERATAEREFLAQLAHANIARILDGGTTPQGLPYVVMEYVDGLPIDQHVQRHAMSVRQRVVLFLQVLDAIDAAHRALIIHRDIKPGNVLVDQTGQVKLLDFGIAKSLSPSADRTQTAQMALTPSYAAPEQLEAKPLGTTADVYAAGVLLFELLAGRLPVDPNLSLAERMRSLGTTKPVRASQRADTEKLGLAERAGHAWRRELHGDLDKVMEKALRYEPEQRYRSAHDFAADLQRWLDLRPVLARNGGVWYALRKFVQRNRLSVAAGLSAVLALGLGLGFAWHQAKLTQQEAQRTLLANRFLTDLISSADPNSDTKSASLIDAIDRAEKDIPERFAGEPALEANVRLVVGRGYYSLNRLNDAEKQFLRVQVISPARGLQIAGALNGLADIDWSRGEMAGAEAKYRAAIATLNQADTEQRAAAIDLRGSLTALLSEVGRYDESIALAQANLDQLPERAVHTKTEGAQRAALLGHYAYGLHGLGKTEQAVEVYTQAIKTYERYLPLDHPDIALALNNQAMALLDLHRKAWAAKLMQRSVDIRRARFGNRHWMMVTGPANLAGLRAELGEFDESCRLLQEAFATAKVALEPNDLTWGRTINTAARIALIRQDYVDAAQLAQMAITKLAGKAVEPSYLVRARDTLQQAQSAPANPSAHKCALRF